MKRTGRLQRTTPLTRSGAPRPRKRSAASFARVYGSPERAAWVKTLPCLVCAMKPCDNAHTGRSHTGYKAGYETIVPLCSGLRGHHAELHRIGRATFERTHAIDLAACAVRVEQLWQERRGLEPVGAIVARVLPTITGEDA